MLPRDIFGDYLGSGIFTWIALAAIYIPFLIVFIIKKKTFFYHITFILFLIYCRMLFGLVFLPFPINSIGLNDMRVMQQGPYFNIIPFHSIFEFVTRAFNDHWEIRTAVLNIFGNIIAFMPFGFLFPCLFRSFAKMKKFVFVAFFVPLGVELTQLAGSLAMGAVWKFADIDDVILNMTGMILGLLILHFFLFVIKKQTDIDFFDLIYRRKIKPQNEQAG